jgi:hypothetical protein
MLAVTTVIKYPKWLSRLLPYLALVYVQILFAFNVERLFVVGFPVVILLAAVALTDLKERFLLPSWYLVCLPTPFVTSILIDPKSIEPSLPLQGTLLLGVVTLAVATTILDRRHQVS